MGLAQKQMKFAGLFGQLLVWIASQPELGVTLGEAFRTPYQQAEYIRQKKSTTINSKHLLRLAVDLNLFINCEYKTDRESYKVIGEYWKSLDPDCIWGGDWGWDANHFQLGR